MKRIFSILLALLCIACAVACGETPAPPVTDPSATDAPAADGPFALADLPHYCSDPNNSMMIRFDYANWEHDYISGSPVMMYTPTDMDAYPTTNISIYRIPMELDGQDEGALTELYEESLQPHYAQALIGCHAYKPMEVFEVDGEAAIYITLAGEDAESGDSIVAELYLFRSHRGIVQLTSFTTEEYAQAIALITRSMIESYVYLS